MSAEAEVAALRLMLREVATLDATGIDYALRCQRERDEARAEVVELRALLDALLTSRAVEAVEVVTDLRDSLDHARFMARGWRRHARDMRNDRSDGLALLRENDTLREAARVAEADAQRWQMAATEYRTQRDEQTERLTEQLADLRTALTAATERAEQAEAELDAARMDAAVARADLAAETATRAALRTQESQISGILADAGVPVGDLVRGVEALVRERDTARAWSRLWHREARRLWREVQALSGELDVIGWRVRYEWRPEISCSWSEARSDLLSFPDARATASNLRRDPRTYAVRVMRVYRRRRPT